MSSPIVVVDYGMGNLHSVRRRFERLGVPTSVSSEPDVVAAAEKLVLPGVGHFQRAMDNLRERRLLDALDRAVKGRRRPVLGICLGMQLLALRSEEGESAGLGWIDADVVRFRVANPVRHKVPQMGWNEAVMRRSSPLLGGLGEGSLFYFAHAYHLVCRREDQVLCETEYDYPFASAVQSENVFGVQFHPEKSHEAGDTLLRNFAAL